ncbi:cytochrome B6 [Xylophilus sp. Kf1]|nr:cytochrome B6 [Xylophilus sp. Kf1]
MAAGLVLGSGVFAVRAQPVIGGSPAPEPIARVGDTPRYGAIVAAARPLAAPAPAAVALGRLLFFDPRLSQPRGTSCAGCHDAAQAFTGFNGGRDGVASGSVRARLGFRNPPSLTYVRFVPPLYFYQDDDAQQPSPFGGLMLDGRADTLAQQVREPLLARHEMNLGTDTAAAARLRATGYRDAFEALYGAGVLNEPRRAVRAFGASLEAYLQSAELSPFDSRFDALLQGDARALSAQEMRGLAVFRDPDKGNCASCHSVSVTARNPARSLFTDFGYEALGVPRNRRLPSTASATAFDPGLCRTARARHWPDPESWCGYFRTPSLRNVAVRTRFMHNGVFDSLRETVRFYATRSTDPAHWYGGAPMFDDMPARLRGNVNVVSTPLNRKPGATPAMSEEDIDAVVAFLGSLTDRRYRPDGR